MQPSVEIKEKFAKLYEKIAKFEKKCSETRINEEEVKDVPKISKLRVTLDDIQHGIILNTSEVKGEGMVKSVESTSMPAKASEPSNPYIKILLKKCEDILLYESRSETVLRDTQEGEMVLRDNEQFIYLTEGLGKKRRMGEAETQTNELLLKSREVNTETIVDDHKASYVSNFEMFDTYVDLEKSTKSINVDGKQEIKITTYKVDGVDKFLEISEMPNFKLASMLVMRILAGNVFEAQQRRFRNMHPPNPLALTVSYKYSLNLLWRNIPDTTFDEPHGMAVSDMSWCPRLGDILAVAYGIYSHTQPTHCHDKGLVRIWTIKNPVNPERCYAFPSSVITVEFSPYLPQLLAVGLLDGSVQVIDISREIGTAIAISELNSWSSFEPITNIKWLPRGVDETFSVEPFLAVSQNGSVIKYRLINSQHLLGFLHNSLDRVVGCNLEGIAVPTTPKHVVHAIRHPQGLGMTLNPIDGDIFYVFTDEGCLHKCSMNYPQQTLAKLQAAEGTITSMDFSPFSPHLFLTCGNDW